jgi:hypothetical protein
VKKLLCIISILLAFSVSALFGTNAITTGTLTLVSGTTYRIASGNYYKANLLLDYVKGDSTSVTIQVGYRYTDAGLVSTTTYIASLVDGTTNVATDDAIVLSATAARQIPLNTSKSADWIYFTFTFDGGTTATLRADVILDYTQ